MAVQAWFYLHVLFLQKLWVRAEFLQKRALRISAKAGTESSGRRKRRDLDEAGVSNDAANTLKGKRSKPSRKHRSSEVEESTDEESEPVKKKRRHHKKVSKRSDKKKRKGKKARKTKKRKESVESECDSDSSEVVERKDKSNKKRTEKANASKVNLYTCIRNLC